MYLKMGERSGVKKWNRACPKTLIKRAHDKGLFCPWNWIAPALGGRWERGRGGGGGQWATCIVIRLSLMPRQVRIPVIPILVGMGEYVPPYADIDVSQWRCQMGFGLTSTIVNVHRSLLVKTANKVCISFSLLTTSYVVWFARRRLSLVTSGWPCSLIVICN